MKQLFVFFLLISPFAFSQTALELAYHNRSSTTTLPAWLNEIEKENEVRFYFLENWINDISLDARFNNKTLREVLDEAFSGTDLDYFELNQHAIIIIKNPSHDIHRSRIVMAARAEGKQVEKITIGEISSSSREQKITISGLVVDKVNKNPLVGANILVGDLNLVTKTDKDGKFAVLLPAGAHIITCSFINYDEKVIELSAFQDGTIKIDLEETPVMLEEITVTDRANEITRSLIGQTQMSMTDIKRAPALLGEVDLIKQIQTLPGISTAGEAASGFNVRGGGADQNLILYDGLPVFNTSHVFGFFSTFNAEAIRDVSFYKSSIPSEFGGRISSVLDIQSKEGDYTKWKASGGAGIVSSNIMVSGPIKRDKTSIALSVRSTYSDWLINTIKSNYVDLENSSVSFYDGAIKLGHKFNERTKITTSLYASSDQFRLAGDSTYRWKNLLTSLKVDHALTGNFTMSVHAGFGTYGYDVFDRDRYSGFELGYRISYPSAKVDFNYQLNNHKIVFGLQSHMYRFDPGTLKPTAESNKKNIEMPSQNCAESALFISDQFNISEGIHADIGLRLSHFVSLGPATVYIYNENAARDANSIVDTVQYSKRKPIRSFNGMEPRIGIRFDLSESASIKVGFNRIYQYLHLVTNTTAITPVDIWQPSGYYFKPQMADQASLGYYRTFRSKQFEAFVEVYYKKMHHVPDYKDGATLLLNPLLEADLLQGNGRAYGVESQIDKKSGRLTGNLNYSYSRSFRKIRGQFPAETINYGKEYPSNFDQPHIVNLNWRYMLSKRHFFTGAFTYHTGRPITLPLASYTIEDIPVSSFSERNQYRVPDYHRLDIGLVIEGNHKRKKLLDGTWTFSIYNVYARKNPYSIFFKEVQTGALRPYRLSVIGTALPSISYNFKI